MDRPMSAVLQARHRLAGTSEIVAFISFLMIFLYFSVAAPNFLIPLSLSNILTFASITGIVTIAVAVLMITGEFDLSVGSTLAVAGYVFAMSINGGVSPLLAMVIALLVSAMLGLINGLIVVRTGIPSFIATLGTLLAYRGIAQALGGGDFASFTEANRPLLFNVMNGSIDALNKLSNPAANFRVSFAWFLGIAAIMALVMGRMRFGNWAAAVGGNPGAAVSQGVPVNRVKLTAFVLTGLFAGLAGVIQFSQRMSIDPLRGQGLELVAVAACVIGGVRLTGGYGTVIGACLGVLLLQVLQQGLVLMGLDTEIFYAVSGVIIILAVLLNTYLSD